MKPIGSLTVTIGENPTTGAAVPMAVLVELDGASYIGALTPEEPDLDHEPGGIPVQVGPARPARWAN